MQALHDALTAYFAGEKTEALVFILPLGLLSMVFGAWLLVDGRDGFSRGAGWPFVVLGLALSVTGGAVGFRTPSQVARLEADLASARVASIEAEQARMKKVNANWPVYLTAYVVFALGGLAVRFFTKSDVAHGAGVALVFFAGMGLLIDGFAERRAQVYVRALEAARGP